MQILKHELLVVCLVFLSSEQPVILGTVVLVLVVAGSVWVPVVLVLVVWLRLYIGYLRFSVRSLWSWLWARSCIG